MNFFLTRTIWVSLLVVKLDTQALIIAVTSGKAFPVGNGNTLLMAHPMALEEMDMLKLLFLETHTHYSSMGKWYLR